MENKKILITGGAGFIGANLTEHLLAKTNWKINILDNLSSGGLANLKGIKNYTADRISFLEGDVRDKDDTARALNNCRFVVNLAAQTGVVPSQKNPLKDAKVNIIGTINLLEEAKKQGIKTFIQASSAAPLGKQKMPLDEKKVPRPLSPYGASKLAGEAYCSAFAGSFDLPAVVLRFSNVYGACSQYKTSAFHKFIRLSLAGRPVTIYGDGKQTRDFIHVKDICRGIYLALTQNFSEKFNLFQLGTGKETSINKLFKLIKKELEKKNYQVKKPLYKKARDGEIKKNYTDITKAKKVLGFKPQIKISKGIQKTINWCLDYQKNKKDK